MDIGGMAIPVDDDLERPASNPSLTESRWRTVPPRLLAAIWLVLLGNPLLSFLDSDPPTVKRWLGLIGLALFITTYIWQLLYHPLDSDWVGRRPSAMRWAPVMVLTGLSVAMTLGMGPAFLLLFVFAGVSVGACLPTESAPVMLGAVIAIATLCGAISGPGWSDIAGADLTIFGIGTLIILLAHLTATVRELRSARLEIARLAVSEERLRFSRDLHDLLGHSLSLITLKSELAGRMIETNPKKAIVEIHDIERIARSALQETRETVAGYRQPTLAGEIRAAREMVMAAGISFVATDAPTALPSEIDSVLAWTVREGVTNVIRHSRATRCTIKVAILGGEASVEVTDNGTGSTAFGKRAGNGLKGLTERVTARAGSLDARPKPDGGFCLMVTIPVTPSAHVIGHQPQLAHSA
jgi:two-component system sensor histidine kinase DesK